MATTETDSIELVYGRSRQAVTVRRADWQRWQPVRAPDAAPVDAYTLMREALEHPLRFAPLRRALTPDDRVVVVVDEQLPHLPELLRGLLEHLHSAGVRMQAVTLLVPASRSRQNWLEVLPEAFEEIQIEIHNPSDRDRISYLASTRGGERIYLNRTLIDADQLIVLAGRRFDPLTRYSGAETAIYPTFSDEHAQARLTNSLSWFGVNKAAEDLHRDACEIARLLGSVFLVQVIESEGDQLHAILAGLLDTSRDGIRLLRQCRRANLPTLAKCVIATISGDPTRHTFADMAAALGCAARVVEPDGQIALLTEVAPHLPEAAQVLRTSDTPEAAIKRLKRRRSEGAAAVLKWAYAATRAHLYIHSQLSDGIVEELFATPIEHAKQVQRLLDAEGPIVIIPDAHKHQLHYRPE
jgi:nickel-dependent lactate racemase